jgi:tetratricopeptide (TPR) repeat protein
MTSKPKRPANPILDRLRKEVRSRRKDPDVHYRLAVVLLNPAQLRHPTKRHRLRAKELLSRAIDLRHDFAPAHALLAYVLLELEEPKAALQSLRKAVDLSPNNETYQDFLLETLDRAGHVRALQRLLEKVAKLRKTNLAGLRVELKSTKFPTDPSTIRLNAFPAGERHFVSELLDRVEAIEREYSSDFTSDAELAEAARLSVSIDARRVPANLRPVIYLAEKWGVSDDAHRGVLINQASASERTKMRKALTLNLRRQINDWIDSFADASSLSGEAAHFMYLLEAYEEM